MKNFFCLFLLMGFTIPALCQLDKTYRNKSLTPMLKKPGIRLSTNEPAPGTNMIFAVPEDQKNKMPVLKLSAEGLLKGNNGKGADIYVYQPDNMPVLKPNETFKSNMPVAGAAPKEIKP